MQFEVDAIDPEPPALRDTRRAIPTPHRTPRPINMAPPSPKPVELARRIVEHEAGGSQDPADSAAAVETACRRLKGHLIDLLGSGGVSALLKRGLHLAQREQPLLRSVAVSGTPNSCFTGLRESLAAGTNERAAAAAAAILTHIIDLLVVLLGEDLGLKPIRKLWPEATSGKEIDE